MGDNQQRLRTPVHLKLVRIFGDTHGWWSDDHEKENIQYCNNISSDYIRFRITLISNELNNPSGMPAIYVRQLYSECLEFLFSILFASIQDISAVPIWMNGYTNTKLRKAVKDFRMSGLIIGSTSELLSISRVSDKIASTLFPSKSDSNRSIELRCFLVGCLNGFTKDYGNDDIYEEYNAIKHGNRIKSGKFELRFAKMQTGSENRPNDDEFHTLVKSESTIHYSRVVKIRKINKITDFSLEEVNSTVEIKQYVNRILLVCNFIDIIKEYILISLGLPRNNRQISTGFMEIFLAWRPNEKNGTTILRHKYYLDGECQEKDWGYDVNFQPSAFSLGINYAFYATPSHIIPLLYLSTSKSNHFFIRTGIQNR